ncbi:mechanosensitive ion channel [Planctomonas sp. JC2975]|uniref:mechanosensitive ion channel family protein n=1 Tax=Planctomonas sp. JC2975 TaxID=2729626 RepID=UPI001474D063|nr:mechanosensitive ion channel domain-containing protein [Planctomonas sp. JC2975]NNC10462.1 mechanosensitive ion channel [Planctomonas sp. JC2975]
MHADTPNASDAAGFLAGLDPWDVAFAVISVVLGIVFGVLAKRGTQALLARIPSIPETVAKRIASTVRLVLILLGVGIALTFLGAPIQPVIALAIVLAVIAVLALRGIAENYAAGLVIQTRRPFTRGDVVRIGDYEGVVAEINGRSVAVRQFDGSIAHIPNASVLSNPFLNESERTALRGELEVRVRYRDRDDLDSVVEGIRSACAGVSSLIDGKHAEVLFVALAPDRATLAVRYRHRPTHKGATRSDIVSAVYGAVADRDAVVTSEKVDPPLTPPAVL